jgi:hypothetical protein
MQFLVSNFAKLSLNPKTSIHSKTMILHTQTQIPKVQLKMLVMLTGQVFLQKMIKTYFNQFSHSTQLILNQTETQMVILTTLDGL